jgi:hypothetical protein
MLTVMPEIPRPELYYGGQKILAVTFCHFKKQKIVIHRYFTVIMITVLIMIGFFRW